MKGQRGGKNRGAAGKGKAHKAFCRAQARRGLWNDANGNWVPIPTGDAGKEGGMIRGYKGGYKLGR